jgi:clan AA aspartic protease
MPYARYSAEEVAERGESLYASQIRPLVEADNRGKFVVIDIETGSHGDQARSGAAAGGRPLRRPRGLPHRLSSRRKSGGLIPVITGVINADREAILPLEVIGTGGARQEVTFTIDTGFNGYLTLPEPLITSLGLSLVGNRRATLGDGSIVTFDTFLASVDWDGSEREVLVLQADVNAVLGMALLYGSRVTIDVVDGGVVAFETIQGAT